MQSCAIAALVVLVGRWLVKRVKFLRTYCIPGVVVCGLIVSIVLSLLKNGGVLTINFDVKVLKEFFMDIFFTAIGLTASSARPWPRFAVSDGRRRHLWCDRSSV